MEFRCNAAPNAAPCVHIATTDNQGRALKKPKRTIKVVRNGDSVFSWIDRCSRKHFTAVDDEAKRLNREDYKEMVAECKVRLIPIPEDATFAELADSIAALDYKTNAALAKELPRRFLPVEAEEVVELTNAQLKAKIEDLGGEYPAVVNKAQLKDILAELEADKAE